jgi:hypothetical protein
MIARAPRLVKHKSSSPPLPARMRAGSGRAELISPGDRAVWARDQFEQVAVRVVEIGAPAGIEMIDLARPLTPEIRVVLDTAGADAGESSVEFGIADQEGIVLRAEPFGVGKIEGDPVARVDRHEVAPFRSRFRVQNVGEEPR